MRLSTEDLRAGYGTLEVLHGVSVTVPEDSVVALLGANGAGKTTMMKTIAGLISPSGGRVVVDNEDVTHMPAHVRARRGVCLVPADRSVFRDLSVRDNLALFAGGKQVQNAVDRVAAIFPVLAERERQLAGTLSGGQQQMLSLSRALVQQARVVLADELSLGLAPVVVDEIFDALASMRQQGQSILLVEQYAERALELADYVYVLHKGTISFVGEPAHCRGAIFEEYLGGADGDLTAALSSGVTS